MKRPVSLIIATVILVGVGLFLIPSTEPRKTKKLTAFDFLTSNKVLEEGGEQNKLDNPHLAALQDFEMTKDPALGYPPTQRKIDAFLKLKAAQRNQDVSESAIPGVEWIERGSDNVGGRTRALMFDPQDESSKKVWAGSTGGGLWFNNDITDATSSWQNVTGFMGNLDISSIDYDPTNNSTFYIGTGLAFSGVSQGDGVWKSTDSGVTWNQLSSTANGLFDAVQDIKVTSAGTVLVATLTGLKRSTDGGVNWTTVAAGEFADIEIAANDEIYASTGVNSSGSLFKSTDDGQNLTDITPQTGGRRIEIGVAPSNASVVYAVAEGGSGNQDIEWFKRSDDGGSTWRDLPIPLQMSFNSETGLCEAGPNHFTRGQAFFDLVLAVHPMNEDIVIAGGIDVHRSVNGGDDWEGVSYWTGSQCDAYVHADQHAITFRPGFPNEAIFGNDGGIDYSNDIGTATDPNFERRVKDYNTLLFYSIAMANEAGSNVMIAGAQDNGTQRFSEPGINSTRTVFGGDGTLSFIDQTDPNIQLSAFVFNFIVFSDNGGLSFTTIESDQTSGRFVNPADYDSDQGTYFSAGDGNEIKRIQGLKQTPEDQETLTVSLGGGQISAIKVSPHTANRIFVGTGNGNIYRIDNTDLSPMQVTSINGSFNGTQGTFLSGIDIGATDDQILITYSNFGVSSIYETTNGGTNWLNKEGNLPDVPVRDGLYNPENRSEVLVATELGVWSTTGFDTATPVWEATNSGLASVRVNKLEYRESDKLVAAATYGRGIFTSSIFSQASFADFKSETVVGYAGSPISFTDGSLESGGDFAWDFGDGNTSTDQNPSHTYSAPGTYDVSLAINSAADTETKANYITILPVKSVPYTPTDGGDFESNPDDFASASILNDVNLWERGAPTGTLNTPSSGTNAWKTRISGNLTNIGYDYSFALYTPAFDLSNPAKDYTLKFKRSGHTRFCNAPIGTYMEYSTDGGTSWTLLGSSFEEEGQLNWYNRGPNLGCLMDRDVSPSQMGWNENNETITNVDTQIKLNQFAGNSNVSFRFITTVMTGFNEGYDRDGFMIDDFEIEALDATADFTADRTIVPVNGPVQFRYASNGAESFAWDFGDGNTSTDENPIHSYTSSGSYTVGLTVMVNGNSITETKTDFINVSSAITPPYLLADGGDFESNQDNFIAINVEGTPFELGSSSVSGKNGTASGASAWVTGINETTYVDDSRASLESPSFIFNQAKEYTLEFKANFSFEDEWDGFIVQYSTDLGESYTKLNNNMESGWYTQISDPESIFGVSTPIFSGNTGGSFQTFSTDVSFLYPNESVIFRFLFLTDVSIQDAGVAIDDFQLLVEEPVPPTADFTASATVGCSGQIVTFTNSSTGSIKTYEWNFGANASPATATGAGPHDITYSGIGASTVSLRTVNDFGGEDTETKTDLISTSASHSPTFVRGETSDPEIISLTASTGDSYQWYRNNAAISGATDQILETGENGLYTVEVTINGCAVRATTLNVVILVTGLEDDIVFSNTVTMFPNPVKSKLNIKVSNEVMGQHGINFYNTDGRLIRVENQIKDEVEEIFTFDISNLPQGNYLIQVVSPKGVSVKKVIKQ